MRWRNRSSPVQSNGSLVNGVNESFVSGSSMSGLSSQSLNQSSSDPLSNQSLNQSSNQSLNQSNQSLNQSNQSLNQSNQSLNQSLSQSLNRSLNQSYQSSKQSYHPLTHPSPMHDLMSRCGGQLIYYSDTNESPLSIPHHPQTGPIAMGHRLRPHLRQHRRHRPREQVRFRRSHGPDAYMSSSLINGGVESLESLGNTYGFDGRDEYTHGVRMERRLKSREFSAQRHAF